MYFLRICIFMLWAMALNADAETIEKRVYAHLVIHDPTTAVVEARQSLYHNPNNPKIWESYIRALAKNHDEKEMMNAWNSYAAQFPNAIENHELIEAMAWGVIEKGSRASSPLIRVIALAGAFLSHDAKGIELLCQHMSDNNSCVRGVSVELASEMRDAKLCDEVLRLFHQEKVPKVREAVIEAIGKMKIKSARSDLVAIVANPKSSAQEKSVAIQALVEMLETADKEDIRNLATSNRAGLRLMACHVVSYFDLESALDLIFPLLRDPYSEVRAAAISTFGSLGVKSYREYQVADLAAALLNDSDPDVAISAAKVLTIHEPKRGQEAFQQWLRHDQQDIRIFAAGSLSACGKYSLPLLKSAFKETKDPYVKMNLALGLIGQRECVEPACEALCSVLMDVEERLGWKEKGDCRMLVPSKMAIEALSLDSSTIVNQQVRLDILNIVAIMEYSKTQEALSRCLEHRQWGVAGNAAVLLLTEGDDAALDLVRKLLDSNRESVRVQAALILALWGREEQVINILQEAYVKADRELKEHILEGIGKIGAQSSIPFLISTLQESSQVLRIYGASALLQALYN